VNSQTTMPVEDILALEAALLNLSITCYPEQLENVDNVYKFCSKVLEDKKEDNTKQPTVRQIIKLLTTPLESFKNILTVLKLQNYQDLIAFLSFANRKRIAVDITRTSIEHPSLMTEPDQVNKLLELISPLVKEEQDVNVAVDEEEFVEEQNLVSSLVHLLESPNVEQLFGMYMVARKHFGQGGPKRIRYTLVPLVFRVLKLANRLKQQKEEDEEWGQKAKKVFKFALDTTSALAKTNLPDLSLRLFLQCAQAADLCGSAFETIAYEFLTQAFVIYEEQIADSAAQLAAITLIVGALHSMSVFGEDNYDTLITKTALYASKLLKKPDQCRAIYMVSHLFWAPNRGYKNSKRVLECLQKSLKIADACIETSMNVLLFVEILNEYLYYFDNECEAVTIQYLSGLIALINTNIANMDTSTPGSETSKIAVHYQNTLNYIRWKTSSDPRYKEIEIKS